MVEQDRSAPAISEGGRQKVDALFSGEPPPPPIDAGRRIHTLKVMLAIAIPLDLFGIPCWTGVPGAALTLVAWLMADGDLARIEAGQFSSEDAATLLRLRTVSAWTLGFCVLSLLVQVWLLSTPAYPRLFEALWDLLLP